MKAVFVDTSAWWAFFVARDQWHPPAHRAMVGLLEEKVALVTTNEVLGELVTGLSGRAGHPSAIRAGNRILDDPRVLTIMIDPGTWRDGWRLFQRQTRSRVSLTDCTSAAVMRERRIKRIFTFDEDFRSMGFEVVPTRF